MNIPDSLQHIQLDECPVCGGSGSAQGEHVHDEFDCPKCLGLGVAPMLRVCLPVPQPMKAVPMRLQFLEVG
jgi:DnaJ-class molecular chaperone